jgi:hypothetical protein
MRKCLLAMLCAALLIPGLAYAQKAGSFIFGMDIGLGSATGDFATSEGFKAGSGFGLGAELRYALIKNLSLGPFVKYNRFGSSLIDTRGHVSYNFTQYGGAARFNLFNLQSGKIYVCGGGGLFKPNAHYWSMDLVQDVPFETGTFFNGGLGICSDPTATVIYELEFKYNAGNADYATILNDQEIKTNFKFDFIQVSLNLSFNSKGVAAPPRY